MRPARKGDPADLDHLLRSFCCGPFPSVLSFVKLCNTPRPRRRGYPPLLARLALRPGKDGRYFVFFWDTEHTWRKATTTTAPSTDPGVTIRCGKGWNTRPSSGCAAKKR